MSKKNKIKKIKRAPRNCTWRNCNNDHYENGLCKMHFNKKYQLEFNLKK